MSPFDRLGAAAADPAALDAERIPDRLLPADDAVASSWVAPGRECSEDDPYATEVCRVLDGDPAATDEVPREIVVIGNSHSEQFSGAMLETLRQHPSWSLRLMIGRGCTYPDALAEPWTHCGQAYSKAEAYVETHRPDLVMLPATRSMPGGETVFPEIIPLVERLEATGAQVIAFRDNPRFDFALYPCAQDEGFDALQCQGVDPRIDIGAFQSQVVAVGAIWIDLNAFICPGGTCAPAMGGVVTYLDESHLTAPFARTLGQRFTDQLSQQVEWWPELTFRPPEMG